MMTTCLSQAEHSTSNLGVSTFFRAPATEMKYSMARATL